MSRAFLRNVPLKTCLTVLTLSLFCLKLDAQCPNISLPVAQGFNSMTYPSCWFEQYINGTDDIQFVSSSTDPTTNPQEGADFVMWNAYNYNAGDETRLVSPPITTTGTPSVDVSFYWYNENNIAYNMAPYLDEGVTLEYSYDSINWVTVQFYPRSNSALPAGSSQWSFENVTLPAAAGNQPTVYIGFDFYSEYGDNCSLDNLHIQASLACAGGPSGIGASTVGSTTATINWTAAPSTPANGYNWRVVLSGDSVNGIAIDSGTTTSLTANVTGLSANTSYDIYVQSDCGGSSVGYWIGPVTFTTACAAYTSLPWTEGFEGLGTNVGTDILPPCWLGTPSQRWTSADAPLFFPNNISAHTGNNYIYDFYNATDTIFTPGFSLTTGVTYEFYYYFETDGYAGWDSIKTMYGTSQNPSGMTTLIGRVIYSPVNTTYVKYVAQFTPAASGVYYFGVNLNSSFQPSSLAFDDFGLKIAPACPGLVSNEAAGNLSSTSATLSWTAAAPAPSGGYNWELVATGDSVNGTVLFSGTTAAGVVSVTATGLSPNTSYDLYVQTNCGNVGDGDWTGPLTFVTPCAAITTLPWTEGFEGLGTNTGTDILPPCWLPTPAFRWTTSSAPLTFGNITPRTGSNFLYDFYGADDTVFTPGFTLTGGTQYEFYFYYQTDGNTGWDSLYAMYGSFQNQASMTRQIGPVIQGPTNTTYQKYSAIFTPATSGTYYFGVRLTSTFTVDAMGFDDFGLQKVVPCPNPPLAGVISGPSGVCPGSTATLNVTGYSPYTELQWQTSSDSINFTDLVGATQDNISTTISSVSYYRVKVKCADSVYTAVFPVYINSPIYCYCSNLGGACGFYNIDTVSILSTNFNVTNPACMINSAGSAFTQYADTGSATTTLQRGGSYTISIYLEESTISSAWIDFNQNGIFEASEWVQLTTFSSNGTAVITVPATATLGLTGMRVRTNFSFGSNGANNACTRFFDGQTLDFVINIGDTICSYVPTVTDMVSNVSCYGGTDGALSLNISGNNGPYTSYWSTGDTTAAIAHLRAGKYVDTISFDYGCRYFWSADTVAQPSKIISVIDSVDGVICFGGTGAIYQTPAGGIPPFYTNHWSTGDTTSYITGYVAGVYTDTVTDSRGCRVPIKDTLPGPTAALTITIDSVVPVACNGQSNGEILINVTGGTFPFNYDWSNGSTASNLTNVSIGHYSVNVTDHNGCTASASDSITEPSVLVITKDSVKNASCYNSSDGAIYVTVTGGRLDYQYYWSGGIPTYNLYLVPAGIYGLTVTDASNCTASITDTINAPPALSITTASTGQRYGGTLGSATATAAGSTSFQYLWSNGDTTATITNLPAGVYTVTATDQGGCSISMRDTVDLIAGIAEINSAIKNFSIYPNPSSGLFNVLIDLDHTVPVQLEVYDITGQLIPATVHAGPQPTSYLLDISDQTNGIYIVKLIAGENSVMKRITLVK